MIVTKDPRSPDGFKVSGKPRIELDERHSKDPSIRQSGRCVLSVWPVEAAGIELVLERAFAKLNAESPPLHPGRHWKPIGLEITRMRDPAATDAFMRAHPELPYVVSQFDVVVQVTILVEESEGSPPEHPFGELRKSMARDSGTER